MPPLILKIAESASRNSTVLAANTRRRGSIRFSFCHNSSSSCGLSWKTAAQLARETSSVVVPEPRVMSEEEALLRMPDVSAAERHLLSAYRARVEQVHLVLSRIHVE
jgi:hypothetical protein